MSPGQMSPGKMSLWQLSMFKVIHENYQKSLVNSGHFHVLPRLHWIVLCRVELWLSYDFDHSHILWNIIQKVSHGVDVFSRPNFQASSVAATPIIVEYFIPLLGLLVTP